MENKEPTVRLVIYAGDMPPDQFLRWLLNAKEWAERHQRKGAKLIRTVYTVEESSGIVNFSLTIPEEGEFTTGDLVADIAEGENYNGKAKGIRKLTPFEIIQYRKKRKCSAK